MGEILAKLNNKLEKAQVKINEGEREKAEAEKFLKENSDILIHESLIEKNLNNFIFSKILNARYGEENAKNAKISVKIIPLSKINYEEESKIVDISSYGQYTINSETAEINYKGKEPKIKILNEELKQFIGKPKYEVIDFIIGKYYEKNYNIPGFEYEKYLEENPDKIPDEMKDGNRYYFIGSMFRDDCGKSSVPCVSFNSIAKIHRDSSWLSQKLNENDRILLFEK